MLLQTNKKLTSYWILDMLRIHKTLPLPDMVAIWWYINKFIESCMAINNWYESLRSIGKQLILGIYSDSFVYLANGEEPWGCSLHCRLISQLCRLEIYNITNKNVKRFYLEFSFTLHWWTIITDTDTFRTPWFGRDLCLVVEV